MWHLAPKFDGCALLRPQSRHPFCVMDGSEKYEAFQDSLGDMLAEINELQDSNLEFIDPAGKTQTVKFLLTGDHKFIHICQGIDKANAFHFCTLCPCSKEEIGDITKDWTISRSIEMAIVRCFPRKRSRVLSCGQMLTYRPTPGKN